MAEEIRAEMVANVWKVVVEVGDELEEGGTVAILESMKMEIPVISEDGGVVTKLAVNEGDVVQEGDLIAVLDEPGAARQADRDADVGEGDATNGGPPRVETGAASERTAEPTADVEPGPGVNPR